MNGLVKIVLSGTLLLSAPVRSAPVNDATNAVLGSVPYEVFYTAANLPAAGSTVHGDTGITFRVVSTLPGVRSQDITLYIDSRGGRLPIVLNEGGYCAIPLSEELLAENPPVRCNQPEGSMVLEIYIDNKLKVPTNGIMSYRELMKPISLAKAGKSAFGKWKEAQSAVYLDELVLRVYDHGGSNVTIRSKTGGVGISGGENGIYRIPYNEQTLEENPDVTIPGHNVWFIGLPREKGQSTTGHNAVVPVHEEQRQ